MKITRRQLRQMIHESTYHMTKYDDDSNKIMAMTSVVMRGIQVSLGKELSEDEEYEYGQEVRHTLENNMPVLNMLYDIFTEIKTGGGFQDDAGYFEEESWPLRFGYTDKTGEEVEFIANNNDDADEFFAMLFKEYGRDYPYSVN